MKATLTGALPFCTMAVGSSSEGEGAWKECKRENATVSRRKGEMDPCVPQREV